MVGLFTLPCQQDKADYIFSHTSVMGPWMELLASVEEQAAEVSSHLSTPHSFSDFTQLPLQPQNPLYNFLSHSSARDL